MIDHVTLKVSDLEKSKTFYEKAFAPFGWSVAFGNDGVFHAFDIGKGFLFEITQHRGEDPITPTHVAFRAKDPESVQMFHRAALAAGAEDNGQPGPRPHYTDNYYACFVHDPDGHNIEAMWDKWVAP